MNKNLKLELVPATLNDYPMIQNMARFYVYDMSRFCGLHYPGWECPDDGLYECVDFKHYFENSKNQTYLIKIDNEVAGFVLLDKLEILPETDFNMGQFFILAKFQSCGIGKKVAIELFNKHPGKWSVGAIPENTKALQFWRKIIDKYTASNFTEEEITSKQLKNAKCSDPYPKIMFSFDTRKKEKYF